MNIATRSVVLSTTSVLTADAFLGKCLCPYALG